MFGVTVATSYDVPMRAYISYIHIHTYTYVCMIQRLYICIEICSGVVSIIIRDSRYVNDGRIMNTRTKQR